MDGYSYIIEMVDRISGPAKTAQQQVQSLTGKLSEEARELKKLEANMADLKATKTDGTAAAKALHTETVKLQKAIDAKRRSVEGASVKVRDMVKGERDAAVAAKEAAASTGGLNGALVALGPYAAAAAAALMLLGGALAMAIVGGAKLALEAAKFKTDTTAALRSALGTSEAARDTFAEIRKISDEIGISEAKAQKLGLKLLDAGVSQKDLGDTIKSIAMLEEVRGAEAAGKLEALIAKSAAAGSFKMATTDLQGTGLAEADVLAELADRMGTSVKAVEAQLRAGKVKAADGVAAVNAALVKKLGGSSGLPGLTEIAGKFQEKISRLFEDVNAAPFLELVREIGALFDSSTVSGEALKWLMTTVFDGVFRVARAAFPYIKVAILELVIVALKLYIAMKPIVAKLREMWSTGEQGEATTHLIRTMVGLLAGVVSGLILAAGYWLIFASYGIQAWSAIIGAVSSAYTFIVGIFTSAHAFLTSIFGGEQGSSIASGLMMGLVGGIVGAGPQVVNALVGVGKSAVGAVKKVLGIASPSRVMAEMGGYTAEGFAMGVEDGTAETQGALEAAVSPPAAAGGGGGAAAGGGGPLVVFEAGAFQINAGSASAAELAELLPARVAEVLEEFFVQMGGAPA